MEIDDGKKGKGKGAKRKGDYLPILVSPGESGKGLPYAPVDWPNPGDVWGWRVGKRIKQNGSHQDRFLIAPESLQEKPTRKLELQSRPHVERTLLAKFPYTDLDAFFKSFTWEVPSQLPEEKGGKIPELPPQRSGKMAASPQLVVCKKVESEIKTVGGISSRTRKASLKKRGRISAKKFATELAVEVSSAEGAVISGSATKGYVNTGCENTHICDSNAAISHNISVGHSSLDCKKEAENAIEEPQAGLTFEEFDVYLDSLDEILALPIATVDTLSESGSIIEARKRLSSLLAMGFSNLVTNNKLKELSTLGSKLQSDPSLTSTEFSMLNLIFEIPLSSKFFLEAKEVSDQVDKFFAEHDTKIASVASLRNEYN